MTRMICFYHSADLDGHCSGAIVKHRYPDCEMIGYNYGDEFPWDKVEGQEVWLVDISLQPFNDMFRLKDLAKKLVLIDHHDSLINNIKESGRTFDGLQLNGQAGCELTWEVCYPNDAVPLIVTLLGRYDVWDHKNFPDALPIQYGAKQYDTHPTTTRAMSIWNGWFCDYPTQVFAEGLAIQGYVVAQNKDLMVRLSFDTELDGLKCLALNKQPASSTIFESQWDPEKYDAMLAFGFLKDKWTVSLYTDSKDINVSIVAKDRGGGGHKQAAGFQCLELPFELPGPSAEWVRKYMEDFVLRNRQQRKK
jgi:oligoribonuclease NrnB/cAMP/cGMP phosphodiesterase (DHH superfamily)